MKPRKLIQTISKSHVPINWIRKAHWKCDAHTERHAATHWIHQNQLVFWNRNLPLHIRPISLKSFQSPLRIGNTIEIKMVHPTLIRVRIINRLKARRRGEKIFSAAMEKFNSATHKESTKIDLLKRRRNKEWAKKERRERETCYLCCRTHFTLARSICWSRTENDAQT